MLARTALMLLLLCTAFEAWAQQRPPAPQVTRHGNWVSGRATSPSGQGCIAGTAAERRGLLQVTIGRDPNVGVVLVLAVQVEGATFSESETVRFRVDQQSFEVPGQAPRANAPVVIVLANTEDEARRLSDLLVAMRRGRELRIEVGSRPALVLPLTGASAALGALRTCAQGAGLMPR